MPRNQEWAKPRSSGISYAELLKTDSHPVPDILKEESPLYLGSDDLPVERYMSWARFAGPMMDPFLSNRRIPFR